MSQFGAGFQNTAVVDAFLVAGAIAVGSAVSRNRRTSVTRAVGTADARGSGRVAV